MELKVKLNGKILIYHISKTCNVNLIVREGKIVEVLESKKTNPVE